MPPIDEPIISCEMERVEQGWRWRVRFGYTYANGTKVTAAAASHEMTEYALDMAEQIDRFFTPVRMSRYGHDPTADQTPRPTHVSMFSPTTA